MYSGKEIVKHWFKYWPSIKSLIRENLHLLHLNQYHNKIVLDSRFENNDLCITMATPRSSATRRSPLRGVAIVDRNEMSFIHVKVL